MDDSSTGSGEIQVSYFSSVQSQQRFEFIYVLASLVISIFLVAVSIYFCETSGLSSNLKVFVYAFSGGYLGAVCQVARWQYRVFAKGRDGQYTWKWEARKFHWRILYPFVASSIGAFLLTTAIVLGKIDLSSHGEISACGISFFFGFFADSSLDTAVKLKQKLISNKH